MSKFNIFKHYVRKRKDKHEEEERTKREQERIKREQEKAKNKILFKRVGIAVIISVIFFLVLGTIGLLEEDESKTKENEIQAVEEKTEIDREDRYKDEEKIAEVENKKEENKKEENKKEENKKEENKKKGNENIGQLKVHYIDVGEGDCALIHVDGKAMLIDAGNSRDGQSIVNYIKRQGITSLNYLILTHPHADHIGGAAAVIDAISVDKILMPKASHTSKVFEDLLSTIQSNGLKITSPTPGKEYSLANSTFKILASNNGSSLNNKSIVNKLVFGNTAFLFTGDAESETESKILSAGYNIKSDVLKVGHHGSNTSTGQQFLSKISPKHAIISAGKGNPYGHPEQTVLVRLGEANVNVYRTDISGTIIATSNGNTITFDKKASPIKQNVPPKTIAKKETPKQASRPAELKQELKPETKPQTDSVDEVFITKTGTKYHRSGCRHLKSKIPISLKEAKSRGYEPCKVCSPPN